jgi:prevent-host-death family protein
MSDAMRTIPLRELRNDVSRILKEVEAGVTYRVTVDGKPMADLVPISERRTFVPWPIIERIIREAPLDRDFMADVRPYLDEDVDDLLR